jgi:hypothetical protein
MPQIQIQLPDGCFERLREHLLPEGGVCEEAAFLFTRVIESEGAIILSVIGEVLILPSGFASRSRFYLELADETRAAVTKRAHDLNAGLIECHSHPGQHGACFSWSDLHGFDDFVPHIRWRLARRPYAALVFATDSVDALAWYGEPGAVGRIDTINAGGRAIDATQFTIGNWSEIYERSTI